MTTIPATSCGGGAGIVGGVCGGGWIGGPEAFPKIKYFNVMSVCVCLLAQLLSLCPLSSKQSFEMFGIIKCTSWRGGFSKNHVENHSGSEAAEEGHHDEHMSCIICASSRCLARCVGVYSQPCWLLLLLLLCSAAFASRSDRHP